MKRVTAIAVLLVAAAVLGGCGARDLMLGTNSDYLFTVMDSVAAPGAPTQLRVQIRGGDFLRGQPGLAVRYYRDGKLFKVAETDTDGAAAVTFTPDAPGNYEFVVQIGAAGLREIPPAPETLLVACRATDAPMVVVDLDKTVVASGFEAVLLGKAKPMAQSQRVLARLAGERNIIYLTHRPDYFGPKSKRWLAENGYPRGPLLMSTVGGFLKGSGAFKTGRIAELQKTFSKIEIGIGDKISDGQAYLDNGMRAIVILDMPPEDDPDRREGLMELAEQLGKLGDKAQVVTGWDQVEKALFDGASYPPAAARKHLLDMARAPSPKAN